jgi:hypothetical protein
MIRQLLLPIAAASMLSAAAAGADELSPVAGRVIHLGAVSGVVYFVPQGGEDHLIATLGVGQGDDSVRFEASLANGQSTVLSVPRGAGERPVAIRFERRGERVFVTQDGIS